MKNGNSVKPILQPLPQNFILPGCTAPLQLPPQKQEFKLPPAAILLGPVIPTNQTAQDLSPPTAETAFSQKQSDPVRPSLQAPIDLSAAPNSGQSFPASGSFSTQMKKTRSEMQPLSRHQTSQQSMQYMELMFQNVSSKYIVGAGNDGSGRNIDQIIQKNEQLQKKVEEQQNQIAQLKEIQSQLSTFVIQHSTMQNIFENIYDENILEILSQAQVSNANIHLSFLFASPLVIYDSKQNKFNEIDQIDHNKEFNGVFESLESTGKLIKYQKIQATLDNLTHTLTENPIALHFSGHGFKEKKSTQNFYNGKKAPLNGYLVIEDEKGQSNFLQAQHLKNMIKSQGSKPEFVFVASCHSQFAGQIFHQAGAKHVICVKESYQISDDASIIFTKIFYKALFSSNKTVCEAFNIAKSHLDNHEDRSIAKESQKFMILYSNDQDDEFDPTKLGNTDLITYGYAKKPKRKHQCTIFGPFADGKMTNKCHVPMFRMETSKVEDFLGRTPEMHQVISCIQNKRIVNVMGIPGIGKTTLIKAIAHYLDERILFKDGIIMLSLRNLDQASMILTRLELIINKKVKDFLSSESSATQDQKETKNIDQKALLEKITNFLKDKVILLVMDNAETPSKKDPKNFTEIIQSLLDNCPKIKFLFTSRYNLGSFENNAEQVIELKELQMRYAVDLLKKKSPRPIEQEEIEELLKIKPAKVLHSNPLKRDDSNGGLENHHMFEILKGHPHAISLAAPLLQNKKLKELYELLNSDEIMNWLENQGIKDTPMSSLKVSMDISIKQLSETEPQAIKIFWLIGLMPGGCTQNDLNVLWGQGWINEVEKLLRASLLVKKSVANENIYQLFPFMNQYASTNMNIKDKKDYHNKISKHLIDLCKDLLKVQSFEARIDRLVSFETNIWACIYRMRDNEIEVRARSPAVSFWQNPSNRATPMSSNAQKQSINQSDNGSSSLNNRPSALSDITKQGPNQPTVEESSSIGDNNLMAMMGLDNLSSENILTDFFDNILSKRFVGSNLSTYGKERSKSEKVIKILRGGDIQKDEELDQYEEIKANQDNVKKIEVLEGVNPYHEENETGQIIQKEVEPDEKSFEQLIIHHQPSLVRRASLESQEQKRFESLLSNQSSNFMKGNLNNSFSVNLQVQNLSEISHNQIQGNSGFISFNANDQLLEQSFRKDLLMPKMSNNYLSYSNLRPQNFNDDASQIYGGQLQQSQDQFDSVSVSSLDNQILQLNTTQQQILNPSFMNVNNSYSRISQQRPLDQSSFYFRKQQMNAPLYSMIPTQQTNEIIPEESMMSYAEDDLDQKSPENIAHQQAITQQIENQMITEEDCKVNERPASNCNRSIVKKVNSSCGSISYQDQDDIKDDVPETPKLEAYDSDSECINGESQADPERDLKLEEQKQIKSEKEGPPPVSIADNIINDIQQSYLNYSMDSDFMKNELDQIGKMNSENLPNQENSSKLDSYYTNDAIKNQTVNNSSMKKQEMQKNEQKRTNPASKRVTIQEELPETSQRIKMNNKETSSSKKEKNKSVSRQGLPQIAIQKVQFQLDQEISNQTLMTIDGCLMVYYITNLLLMGRIEDGIKVIDQFGVKLDNDKICQANIKKMQAYAEAKNGNYLNAKKKYEEALQIFNQYNNCHGQAICSYSIGFLLYSQNTHFIKSSNVDKIFDQARKKFEIAIQYFSKIQHLSGESECHRFLIFIKNKNKENTIEHLKRQKALMKDENQLQKEGKSNFIFLHQQIEISLQLEIVGATPITILHNLESQIYIAQRHSKPSSTSIQNANQQKQVTKQKQKKIPGIDIKKLFKSDESQIHISDTEFNTKKQSLNNEKAPNNVQNKNKIKNQYINQQQPSSNNANQNVQKKYAFGTTLVAQQRSSGSNTFNNINSKMNQNPIGYKKQENKKLSKDDEDSKLPNSLSNIQSENGTSSEEDEKVMNLNTKVLDYQEVEKNGRKTARKGSVSNDYDKSFYKGASKSFLKPSPTVNNLGASTRKQKPDDPSYISRPQSPNVSKMKRSKMHNKSLTSLHNADSDGNVALQQDISQQKIVQFNIKTTTTVTIEGSGSLPSSIVIGPQVKLGKSQTD